MEMGLCPVDVYERGEYDGCRNLGAGDDVVHECDEGWVPAAARSEVLLRASRATQGIVDGVKDTVDDIVCGVMMSEWWLWIQDRYMVPITGLDNLTSRSSKRTGEWSEESTRLALCIGDVEGEEDEEDQE
jgi:hypothetical protein